MSDSYRGAVYITTAGITLGVTQGNFLGVVNGATAQQVNIAGSAFFDMNTKRKFGTTFGEGITLNMAPGQLIPVKCLKIKPSSFEVWGLFD